MSKSRSNENQMPTAIKQFKSGMPDSDDCQPGKDVLPAYEPDDGPLTKKDMESIQKLAPSDQAFTATKSLF